MLSSNRQRRPPEIGMNIAYTEPNFQAVQGQRSENDKTAGRRQQAPGFVPRPIRFERVMPFVAPLHAPQPDPAATAEIV